MKNRLIDPKEVIGWGLDADPRNDPTYPIKRRNDGEHEGYSWPRPRQQEIDVEVLHSIERPNVSAAFGTATPPSGLSGMIRRAAFRASEDRYIHWLGLILADRINVFEGIAHDLAHGKIPNIPKERGWNVSWKYDRKRLVGKLVAGACLASLAYMWIGSRSRSR